MRASRSANSHVKASLSRRSHACAHGPVVRRPITTLRDLATYVHDDALYQAYLNAALILLGRDVPRIPAFLITTIPLFRVCPAIRNLSRCSAARIC